MVRRRKALRLPEGSKLARLRALKWRQTRERRLDDERDAVEFLRDVGLCLASPGPRLPLPSWSEAVAGRPRSWKAGRRSSDARVLAMRGTLENLIWQRAVFETNCLWRAPVLVSRELFPSAYAITGDLDPEADYLEQHRRGELDGFALAVYEMILRDGPIARVELESVIGRSELAAMAALRRTLQQLARTIKIVQVGQTPEHGPTWDAFFRWAPEIVREARSLTRLEAAMKLVAAFVNESIVVRRATTQQLFDGFLAPEVCRRAIDLLVESGQMVESRGKLASSAWLAK